MDLDLGLKITHTVDDHVSSANFRIAKDKSGPVFGSKETESMFILTAHLRGYRRENVYIDINEDGTQIGISGEKPVQEKVMSGWIMYRKEVEMRGFRKVFRIPDGVVLDRTKAKFNVHESTLTIVMPKSVKGIRGVGIEEVKEVDIGRQQLTKPPEAEEVPEKDGPRGEIEEQFGEPEKKKVEETRQSDAKGVDEEGSEKEIAADEEENKEKEEEGKEQSDVGDDKSSEDIGKKNEEENKEKEEEGKEQSDVGDKKSSKDIEKKDEEENKEKEKEGKEQSDVGDEKSGGKDKEKRNEEENKGKEEDGKVNLLPLIIAGIASLVVLAISGTRTR